MVYTTYMLFFTSGKFKKFEEAETKFQAAINAIQIGFIITDQKGEIETINVAAKGLLCSDNPNLKSSLTDPKIINLTCNMDYIAQNLSGIFDIKTEVRKVLNDRKSFKINNLSYKNLFLNIAISPVFSIKKKDGIRLEFIGTVILIEDVTEHRILERSREDFFSIASHELKTPLTIIKGNSEIIKKYYHHKDERLNQILDDIHESSENMIEIVNDFLDISRMEQGKIEFKKQILDIIDLIKNSINGFTDFASSKKLSIKFEMIDGVPSVLADETKVKQVLTNLLDNAIKFTDKGGVTVGLEKEDHLVKVTIKDTGCGISPANQKLIFRKFQLASDDILSRSTAKSTGVGLYISKFMVERMGGRIRLVESTVGKGSTFEFTLPLA